MDIYPINTELPCRIEFFDIEVDSIRVFSPKPSAPFTQLSSSQSIRPGDHIYPQPDSRHNTAYAGSPGQNP